jgi:D-glycero-D-manno-heptose 1,7-bisphosphate phosphatase
MKRRALFLDRDGVINVNHGYVHTPENFDFIDGIFDVCRQAQRLGYLLIVVTNQAGIGRGYYTEEDFLHLTEWMKQQFRQQGITIDAVYFCPDHPEHGQGQYRRDSDCRKPKPGMILKAIEQFDIDPSSSVLIGDKESDMTAGQSAKISKLIFLSEKLSASKFYIQIKMLHDSLPLIA